MVTDERPLSTVTMRCTKHREQPVAVEFYIIKFHGIKKDVLLMKVAAMILVSMLRLLLQTFPNLSSQIGMYQGRIDSCDVTFTSASGRACNTRFKFII
jgi:hypothetical protein